MQFAFKLRTKDTQMIEREGESKETFESARKFEIKLCSAVRTRYQQGKKVGSVVGTRFQLGVTVCSVVSTRYQLGTILCSVASKRYQHGIIVCSVVGTTRYQRGFGDVLGVADLRLCWEIQSWVGTFCTELNVNNLVSFTWVHKV